MTLPQRPFGQTELQPTVLGFGGWELRRISDPEAEVLLHQVLDEGINYIDTSPDYRTSEERIGKYLAGRRDEFILATKCGCNPHLNRPGEPNIHIWDAATLERNIDESLKLLRTDCIDVWQLHNATPEVLAGGPAGEVVETMQKIKAQGKVRYIGASLPNGPRTEVGYPAVAGYRGIQEFMGWGVFDMIQLICGPMARTSEEVITQAAERGLGIVARGLVRNYRDHFPQLFQEAGLEELLEGDEDRPAFQIRFALVHPSISTNIIGTASREHLAANVQAVRKGPLSPDLYEEAGRRFAALGSEPGVLPAY